MSIRKKLLLMIVFTIICTSGIYYHSLSRAVEVAINGIDYDDAESIAASEEYQAFDNALRDLIISIEKTVAKNPNALLRNDTLSDLEDAIEHEFLGFTLRRDNEIIWKSHLQEGTYSIHEYPSFGTVSILPIREQSALSKEENIRFLKQIDFYFDDGSVGIVYIFLKRDLVNKIRSNLAFGTIFISLSLIVILSLMNSFFIYQSISKPLNRLIDGVKNMRAGNFNFSLESRKNDEISVLSNTFESLRKEILESKEVQQKYEHDRKEFIDNITHDINTPITSASMNIDAILDGVIESPVKQKRYLENIRTKIHVISQLLDELSVISQIDTNEVQLHLTKVNISSFIKDVIQEFEYDMRYNSVHFKFLTQDDIIWAIDLEKIHRAILNVVENSIKYKEKSSVDIIVETKMGQQGLIIAIEDNGPGLKEGYSDVFKRFYREDKSRSSRIHGSGLGLSIVKRIIELHDGNIQARKSKYTETGLRIEMILGRLQ